MIPNITIEIGTKIQNNLLAASLIGVAASDILSINKRVRLFRTPSGERVRSLTSWAGALLHVKRSTKKVGHVSYSYS